MLNTFIPRPSITRWKVDKEAVKQEEGTTSETSSQESDYYGTESEKSFNRPKPNLKIGRLSTVKEQMNIQNKIIQKYTRMKSGDDRRF